MLSDNVLVSVVVTSYNQKEKLKRAVDSVLQQTYKNIQIVLVDDCSRDDSQRFIIDLHKEHGEKIKYFLQEKNVGIPKNKNTGFKLCDGELITYLDGDDYFYHTKIEAEINTLRLNPTVRIAYSNFNFVDISGNVIRRWNTAPTVHNGNVFKEVYTRGFPYNTLYRNELVYREVLEKINYYDENIPAFHDWDSRIRMSKFYDVVYVDNIGSAYVDDPAGISKREKRERLIAEMLYVFGKSRSLLSDLTKDEVAEIDGKFNKFIASIYMAVAYTELNNGNKKQALINVVRAKKYYKVDFALRFYLRLMVPGYFLHLLKTYFK